MNNKNYKPKGRKISDEVEKIEGQKGCLRTISLDDLDELYSIVIDLQIITYLNQLVQYDTENSDVLGFLKKENVEMFILEMQIDKIKKLDSLIKKISI